MRGLVCLALTIHLGSTGTFIDMVNSLKRNSMKEERNPKGCSN
jgi:hypothetical protein